MTSENTAKKTFSYSSQEIALICAKAAVDKKGNYSIIYEVGKSGAFTDYFLITSGSNDRQVRAIADEIFRQLKETTGIQPTIEGYDEGRWILVDAGSVIAHVFLQEVREFYDLESLWSDAPRLKIPTEFYSS